MTKRVPHALALLIVVQSVSGAEVTEDQLRRIAQGAIKNLASPDENVRKRSRKKLKRYGPKIIPILKEAAEKHSSEQVRAEAASLLKELGSSAPTPDKSKKVEPPKETPPQKVDPPKETPKETDVHQPDWHMTKKKTYPKPSSGAKRIVVTEPVFKTATDIQKGVGWGIYWLVKNQELDGRWDCQKHGGGQYHRKGKDGGHDVAVTSLALLAFLGAGRTQDQGEFRDTTRAGFLWLEKQQKSDGSFCEDNMTNAIAALALAENYGMTMKQKEPAQKAIDYLASVQTKRGGWDYGQPGERSDSAITPWVVMAVKSAKIAGLKVEGKIFSGALKHFRGVGAGDGDDTPSVEYTVGTDEKAYGSARLPATLLSLQYLGFGRDDPWAKKAANEIVYKRGVDLKDLYTCYFSSLSVFQCTGGDPKNPLWKKWDEGLRSQLVKKQVATGEHKGSWDPSGDKWGKAGGRVMTTAFAVMNLEVYFRYMPVYR